MALSLKSISEINAVSGDESRLRSRIMTAISAKCDSITVDALGNVIALKKGKSCERRVMVATNTDEAGFIVSEITEKGYIKFKPVGAIDPRTIISKRVVIGADKVRGVIGMKAIHLQKKDEREAAVKVEDLYIDIGEKKKSKAEKRVRLGDYITFDTVFGEIGDIIKGKALDRMGIAALITAMDTTPAYDTCFVFSTQREVLCSYRGRGLRTAAFAVKPDIALIVDTTDSGDSYKQKAPSARLGRGAVIEHMDRTSIADAALTERIENLAKEHSIPIQHKMSSSLATIAGAITAAQLNSAAAVIGIPCRYSHTPVSMMNKNDIKACGALCAAFVEESDVIINAAS